MLANTVVNEVIPVPVIKGAFKSGPIPFILRPIPLKY